MKANMVKHYFEPLYISDFSAPLHDIVETLVNILRYAETLGVSDITMSVVSAYNGDHYKFELYGYRVETDKERFLRLEKEKNKRQADKEKEIRKEADDLATYLRLKDKFEGGK